MNGHRVEGQFRTVMSEYCLSVGCPRLAAWSNPQRTYNGMPMGTELYNNAVRRLNERREVVENFLP